MSLITEAWVAPRRLVSIRAKVVNAWMSLSAAEQSRIKVVCLVSLVVAAFHYSLVSLLQTLDYETPLAYVGLVPILAAGLALLHRVPGVNEPPIHDRQVDYIIGLPLMAIALVGAFLLPNRMGLMYWFDRVDLLLLPVFVAGAVVLLFGVRAAWRQRLAIFYLFLAWPWPYEHILLGTLNGFTNVTLSGLGTVLKVVPLAHAVAGGGGMFWVSHNGHSFPVSVVTACSGVDGMVGFLLVGVGFAGTIGGGRIRKTLWLAVGLVVLWVTNLIRLLLIFWAGGQFGENVAINILHPFAGLVVFSIGVVLMALLVKPFGLNLLDARTSAALTTKPGRGKPGTQRVFMATAIVAVASFVLCVNNTQLSAFNPVASASGEPKLASFLADPANPVGWQAHWTAEYTINQPLFGASSRWFRYLYVSDGQGDLNSTLPVTADVINAGGLSGFSQYGVEACYTFHGYVLRDVAKVDLGSGISGQALSYAGDTSSTDWSIVYWIWPVSTSSGTRYERVILYLQNTAGGTVTMAKSTPGVAGLKGALDANNPQQARLIRNRAFLVAFAREVVAAQIRQTDKSANITLISHNPIGIPIAPGVQSKEANHLKRKKYDPASFAPPTNAPPTTVPTGR